MSIKKSLALKRKTYLDMVKTLFAKEERLATCINYILVILRVFWHAGDLSTRVLVYPCIKSRPILKM